MKWSIRNFRFLVLMFLFALFSCKKNSVSEKSLIPEKYRFSHQSGYVNDFDDIFSLEQENILEKKITDFDKQTTNEVGVVTIKSIAPYQNINEFGDSLLENWRFGKDNKLNGIIFLINKKEKQISLRFGKGIKKNITDAEAQMILDNKVLPLFSQGNFYEGILKGFEEIKVQLK